MTWNFGGANRTSYISIPEFRSATTRTLSIIMLNSYANLVNKCRPLTIAGHDRAQWGKIGGDSPQGVEPPVIMEATRYFATLNAGDPAGAELSLFISTVYKPSSPVSVLKNRSIMHAIDNPMVQFVFHKPSSRGGRSNLASELSGHGLIVEDERLDSDDRTENIIWNHHKIGGYPFFTHWNKSIVEQSRALLQEGYLHFLQFAFPDDKDGPISGTWPFADLVFHVFSMEVKGQVDFRYCWG